MLTVLIVVHLIIVLAMVGLVLIQRSEGGGLGMGGGTGGFLTSRGTSNVLTRTTALLAATFFATSLILSILANWDRKPRGILPSTGAPATQPGLPGAPPPLGQSGGGVLDALRGAPAPQPAAPGGPEVPRSQ